MPDAIRTTGGRHSAHPRRDGFLSCGAAGLVALIPCGVRADDAIPRPFNLHLDAFTALDRHEIGALVLVLGILLFAVVTAITLVRVRRRAAATEARLRDHLMAL